MTAKTERAEAGTRPGITREDRRRYSGIAQHPLARRWMLKRLIEAREQASTAESDHAVQRWSAEADRVASELRRSGVNVEDAE